MQIYEITVVVYAAIFFIVLSLGDGLATRSSRSIFLGCRLGDNGPWAHFCWSPPEKRFVYPLIVTGLTNVATMAFGTPESWPLLGNWYLPGGGGLHPRGCALPQLHVTHTGAGVQLAVAAKSGSADVYYWSNLPQRWVNPMSATSSRPLPGDVRVGSTAACS